MKPERINKLTVFGYAVLLILLVSVSCSSPKSAVNAGSDGLAIKGYDTVAYFTMGEPVKGDNQFSYDWKSSFEYLCSSFTFFLKFFFKSQIDF